MRGDGYVDRSDRPTSCGRYGFATLVAAEQAARATESDRGNPDSWPAAYPCLRGCGWKYHVGHLPQPVRDGMCTEEEWVAPVGVGAAMRWHTIRVLKAYGAAPRWSRVGEAWRATVVYAGRTVASKPSRDPTAAAEDLIKRLHRVPRKEPAT